MVLEAEKLLPKMSSFGFLYIPKTKLAFFVYKCYNTVRILNLVKKRRFFRVANIAYIRVSSEDQNTGRQYELFSERGIKIDKFYTEKVSGKSISGRPQLRAMLDYIREDDIIYIESISRLSRSVSDFLKLVELFSEKNVGLVSLKENIDTSTAQGKFITTVFAVVFSFFFKNYLYVVIGSILMTYISIIILDRKSTRLNSSHSGESRMPSSA